MSVDNDRKDEASKWRKRYQQAIYAISHDLGAPLRHIEAFSSMLLEEADQDELVLSDEQKVWLGHIIGAGALSKRMLTELSELSRIYTAKGQFKTYEVEDLLGALDIAAVPPPGVNRVNVDIDRISQAVQDLSVNAQEYGDGCSIEVAAGASGLSIKVINHTGGLDLQQWDEACAPFNRLGARVDEEHIGLGLSRALAVAEKHGGELRFDHGNVELVLPEAPP
ncbi:MAG: ATP-binding protein [Pseudomonadota bacterium]